MALLLSFSRLIISLLILFILSSLLLESYIFRLAFIKTICMFGLINEWYAYSINDAPYDQAIIIVRSSIVLNKFLQKSIWFILDTLFFP